MKVGIAPASRIIRSAASFNSIVEIPGSTMPRKDSLTSAINSPTALILSRSFADFAIIMCPALSDQVVEGSVNVFDISSTVYFFESVGSLVISEQRCRKLVIRV